LFLFYKNLNATIRYVSHDTNYTGGSTTYNTPSTAATNIQLAYNACSSGDSIFIIDNYKNYTPATFNTVGNITLSAGTGFTPSIDIPSGSPGIDINSVNNIRILNLTFYGITNNTTAIALYRTSYSSFSNCSFISNDVGIYFGTGTGACISNRIINNEFRYYTIGIDLYENSDYNYIYKNRLIWGKEKGIWLHRNNARRPEYNYIINNVFMSNGTYNNTSSYPAGVYITETYYNVIQKNLFLYNGNGVIFDGTCMHTKIYNNTFYQNIYFTMGSSFHHSGIEFYQCNDNSNELKGNISVNNNYGYYADNTIQLSATYDLAYNNSTAACSSHINNGNFLTGDGCIIDDPAFKNIEKTNFNLQFFSPAIRSSFSNTTEQASMGKYTISVQALSTLTNAQTTNKIRFTTDFLTGAIPGDGKIKIVYPNGFKLTGIQNSDISSTTMDGSFLTSVSGQTLTITRSGGTASTPGETELLQINNITNCSYNSPTNYIKLGIMDSANNFISEFEDSNDFFIGSPLLLLSSTPSSNEDDFAINANITLTFNDEIQNQFLSTNYIYLSDEDGNKLSCSFSKQNSTNIILNPTLDLQSWHFYTINLSIDITSINYNVMDSPKTIPFYSGAGIETVHTYNTISCDGTSTDWSKTNNVHYLNTKNELLTNDTGDNTPADEAITNVWVTWDSTNIYFRLDKNNAATGFSGNSFQDYIFLDLTHDTKGADSSTYDSHTINFSEHTKPDFRIYVYDKWTGGYSEGYTFEKWNGSAWVSAGTSGIIWQGTGTPPYNYILELGIKSTFLTNHAVSATDTTPNRISVLAYSKWTGNSSATDFCPENQKFINFTPDNNNDGILDHAEISALLTITKSVSNIFLETSNTQPKPGSAITYKISYSNYGPVDATNVIISDKLPLNVQYLSNTAGTNLASGNWTIEFSTNTSPASAFISANFTVSQTDYKKVKWIRFKKSKVLKTESGVFYYSVMIK